MTKKLFLLATLLIPFACRAPNPKVETQEGKAPIRPNFEPYGNVLKLSGEDAREKEQFEGSFIFYNPNVSVKAMEAAIKMSEDIKKAKFQSASFYAQNVATYKSNQDEIARIQKFKLPSSTLTSLAETVNKWLSEEVLTNEDLKANLCDRSIWLAAISPLIRFKTFKQLPMPIPQCSDYYAANGLLDQSDEFCAPSQNGKNYYKCFWGKSGVQKTQTFKPNLAAEDELGNSVTWEDILLAASQEDNDGFINSLAERGVFEKDVVTEFAIFDSGLTTFSQPEYAPYQDKLVGLFNIKGLAWSVYDHLIHFPNALDSDLPSRKSGITTLFEKAINSGVLGTHLTLDDIKVTEEDEKKAQAMTTENAKLLATLAMLEGTDGPYIKSRRQAGDDLYKHQIASTALSGSFLHIMPKEGYIEFNMGFVSGAPDMKTCFDTKQDTIIACPGGPQSQPVNPYTFSWDKATGKINYRITMNDTQLLQLDMRKPYENDPTDNSYQLIDPKEFSGLTLHIELYPRQIKNALDQISGTVRVRRADDSIKYEGTMTMFRMYQF